MLSILVAVVCQGDDLSQARRDHDLIYNISTVQGLSFIRAED